MSKLTIFGHPSVSLDEATVSTKYYFLYILRGNLRLRPEIKEGCHRKCFPPESCARVSWRNKGLIFFNNSIRQDQWPVCNSHDGVKDQGERTLLKRQKQSSAGTMKYLLLFLTNPETRVEMLSLSRDSSPSRRQVPVKAHLSKPRLTTWSYSLLMHLLIKLNSYHILKTTYNKSKYETIKRWLTLNESLISCYRCMFYLNHFYYNCDS